MWTWFKGLKYVSAVNRCAVIVKANGSSGGSGNEYPQVGKTFIHGLSTESNIHHNASLYHLPNLPLQLQ